MLTRGIARAKWLGGCLVALLLFAGWSATAFADLRIVHETEGEQKEMLLKNGRAVLHLSDEDWMMIDCAREEVTLVAPPRYWQGPIAELGAFLRAKQAEILEGMEGTPSLAELFGSMMGSQKAQDTQVRVVQLAEDTVGGYRATQYRVETGDGSQWRTFETVWISQDLLREVEGEIGRCSHAMMELGQQLVSLVPVGDAPIVYSDPSYRALYEQGFPVRSITRMSILGMEWEAQSEIVEVSHATLDEALFTVPATYERHEDLAEFFEH